jgi:DNA-binding MarR family transcriptional regulator
MTTLATESSPLGAWLLLQQTYNLIYKNVERCAANASLSAATVMPLLILKNTGHVLPLSHLAGLLLQEPQSVTSLVDRMEGKGLVRRVPDDRDRRVINVGLTAHGEAVVEHLKPALQEALAESFAPLAPRDLENLGKRLGALRGHGVKMLGLNTTFEMDNRPGGGS